MGISVPREVQGVLLVLELEEIMSPGHAPLTSSGAGGPVGHWPPVGLQHACALVVFFQMCLYQARAGSALFANSEVPRSLCLSQVAGTLAQPWP